MAIGILKSSDNNWYQLTVVLDGVDYVIDINQSSTSAPSPAWPEYWVIKNSENGLNYKVYLTTVAGETALNVDQASVSEPGNPYEILYCSDDSSYHKITVIDDGSSFVLGLNTDKTNIGTISGVASISAGTTNYKTTQAGISRISINSKSSISGLSRVAVNTKANIAGLSRIQSTLKASVSGISRISGNFKSIISGVARIGYSTVISPISGITRVSNTYSSSISGAASISIVTNTNNSNISGVSRVSNNNKATLAGLARVQNTLTSTQSGIAKITAYVGNATIGGKAKIAVRNRFKKSFIIRNEFNNDSPIIIQ